MLPPSKGHIYYHQGRQDNGEPYCACLHSFFSSKQLVIRTRRWLVPLLQHISLTAVTSQTSDFFFLFFFYEFTLPLQGCFKAVPWPLAPLPHSQFQYWSTQGGIKCQVERLVLCAPVSGFVSGQLLSAIAWRVWWGVLLGCQLHWYFHFSCFLEVNTYSVRWRSNGGTESGLRWLQDTDVCSQVLMRGASWGTASRSREVIIASVVGLTSWE